MARARLKPDPPLDFSADEFKTAAAEFREINTRWRAMQEKLEALRLAVQRSDGAVFNDDHVREAIDAKIVTLFPNGMPRRTRLIAQYEDQVDAIERFQPTYAEALKRWERARRRETNRVALELQPKQQAIVEKMLAGLELLSVAIEDERELRREFEKRAQGPAVSVFLPNVTMEVGHVGSFADFASPAAAWLRRMRHIGILKNDKS